MNGDDWDDDVSLEAFLLERRSRWRADLLAGIDAAIVEMGVNAENAKRLRAGMLQKAEELFRPRLAECDDRVRSRLSVH